jgi:transcriptional regulator with XRE-family HTH domain
VKALAQWSKDVFAKNLRTYMERAGKSQKDMADIVGVSTATYSDWINAKKYPRIDKIEIMADYFGILKSDLIEDKMTEEKEKDNETLAGIIVRMRTDEDFRNLVESLYMYDSAKIKSIAGMLDAFSK